MTEPPPYDLAAAIAKWPNVPACHGWLSLDRRGRWRLQGTPVNHAGLRVLLDDNYERDAGGGWLVRNGPQKVFVDLEYMPLVFHFDGNGALHCHTGKAAGEPTGVWLDEEGNVLVETPAGPGLLDSRDLPAFLEACTDSDGQGADERSLAATLEGQATLTWRGLPIGHVRRTDAPACFGFDPNPRATP